MFTENFRFRYFQTPPKSFDMWWKFIYLFSLDNFKFLSRCLEMITRNFELFIHLLSLLSQTFESVCPDPKVMRSYLEIWEIKYWKTNFKMTSINYHIRLTSFQKDFHILLTRTGITTSNKSKSPADILQMRILVTVGRPIYLATDTNTNTLPEMANAEISNCYITPYMI